MLPLVALQIIIIQQATCGSSSYSKPLTDRHHTASNLQFVIIHRPLADHYHTASHLWIIIQYATCGSSSYSKPLVNCHHSASHLRIIIIQHATCGSSYSKPLADHHHTASHLRIVTLIGPRPKDSTSCQSPCLMHLHAHSA